MELLKRIRGAESPTMGYLPIRGDLDSIRLSMHKILVGEGRDKVRWWWSVLDKRHRWFECFLIAVVVVVGGDVYR